jgi:phosphatidylserine/phosphatidylglycerophosphate/cardiolipin synthase-like enzyme
MDLGSINQQPPTGTIPTGFPAGADSQVTVKLEPDSREDIIIQAIEGAKKSVWLEMYTFTDPRVANVLVQAAQSGIDVQVLYEQSMPQDALCPPGQQFPTWAHVNKAFGVYGHAYAVCHAKFMIIDGGIDGQEQAYIMTTNFTSEALGGNQECTNREYVVIDTNPQDIDMLMTIFQADRDGAALPPSITSSPTNNVIVSPIKAHAIFRSLLDSATQSIAIQVEAIKDPSNGNPNAQRLSIEGALLNAAQRSVDVKLMLPPLPGDITTCRTIKNDAAVAILRQGTPPVQVKTDSKYYMHAKLIIIDQHLAFVGSQNLTRESLNNNREVGILISNPLEVQKLVDTFAGDWSGPPGP